MNEDTEIFEMDADGEENFARQGEAEIEADESRAETKIQKVKDELEAAKKEKQGYLDGWQRSKADYVNLIKRAEEERKSAKIAGLEKAAEALLPALDALERSKAHGEIPDGFQGVAKQLESGFASLGLTAIGEIGEQFDPTYHEALAQDKAESQDEDDKITAVLEKGYKIGDRVIRPAKVRVSHFG
jgi:molecular chaperone GrpE